MTTSEQDERHSDVTRRQHDQERPARERERDREEVLEQSQFDDLPIGEEQDSPGDAPGADTNTVNRPSVSDQAPGKSAGS